MANLKVFQGPEPIDHNMRPKYWLNKDKRQLHVFVSFLSKVYPHLGQDPRPKIAAKPGKVTLIPHGYYRIWSRDGTPCKGAWCIGETVEDAAPSSLSHGDARGVENPGKRR